MPEPIYLNVGGLVALGFSGSGQHLLVVTHSGRGVFDAASWTRVARNSELAYPVDGAAIGIGPIEGELVAVTSRLDGVDPIQMRTPDGQYSLTGESDIITVRKTDAD